MDMTHQWPLIRHEEHQKGDTYMIDLYIQGENGINIVQLDPQEYKAYVSIRAESPADPFEKLVKTLLLPPKELSILATGDYHEEKNTKTTPKPKKNGALDSQEKEQDSPKKNKAQEEIRGE